MSHWRFCKEAGVRVRVRTMSAYSSESKEQRSHGVRDRARMM